MRPVRGFCSCKTAVPNPNTLPSITRKTCELRPNWRSAKQTQTNNAHDETHQRQDSERALRGGFDNFRVQQVVHHQCAWCPQELFRLTRIRRHFVVYFCLHRGKCALKGGTMASRSRLFKLAVVHVHLCSPRVLATPLGQCQRCSEEQLDKYYRYVRYENHDGVVCFAQ